VRPAAHGRPALQADALVPARGDASQRIIRNSTRSWVQNQPRNKDVLWITVQATANRLDHLTRAVGMLRHVKIARIIIRKRGDHSL